MSLLSRLVDPAPGEVKISVHQFMAALAELKRSAPDATVANVGTFFNLSAGELTELNTFLTNFYGDVITREQIHDVLLLGEVGAYTIEQCSTRLVTAGTPNLLPLIVQSELEAIARGINDPVLFGCAPTAQGSPNMTLAIAKGAVMSGGVLFPVTAGNVTITTADATKPRFDIVVINSSGAKVVRAGTPSPTPQPPAFSAGDVAIAYVYVAPAAASIRGVDFKDVRIFSTLGPVQLGKITSAVTKNNTNAAQTFVSLTIPNGLFLTGKIIRVSCGGTMLLNSGSPTVTLLISYGGTTMFQDVTGAATADTDRLAWTLDFAVTAQANNDQALNGCMSFSPLGAKTAPTTGLGDLAAASVSGTFNGSAAVDSDAADRILLIQMTMSVANAADEIVMEYATGELL